MSNKRLTAVWDHSKQTGISLLAMLSLADQAADDGFCWPSQSTIARRSRTDRTYISKIMPELVKSGELLIHIRPGTSSQYLVIVGMTAQEIEEACQNRFKMSPGEVCTECTGGVQSTDTPLCTESTGGVQPVHTNPNEPKEKPKVTISPSVSDWPEDWAAQAVDILSDEDEEGDFVEEVTYGDPDPWKGEQEPGIVPKWRDPANYSWKYETLMIGALAACGRKKFATKKEWSAWRKIDKSVVSCLTVAESAYPLEWVMLMINWAKEKNMTKVTGRGSFTVVIKFPALLSAINNEAKRDKFIEKFLAGEDTKIIEEDPDFIQPITENPFPERM